MKKCSNCGVDKDETEFCRKASAKSGLNSCCRSCESEKGKQRRSDNPGENAKRCSARYYGLTPAELKEKNRQNREYRRLNREKVLAQERKKREKNPEPGRKSKREWKERNYEQARESENKRRREKYKRDIENKIVTCLRNRLGDALRKGGGVKKSARTMELVGCPAVWLEVHLESLFRPGMTWDNHGPVWHIDHIKPCAAFNLTDPEQQRICFHWTNLQPLFAEENLKKSDKYTPYAPPEHKAGLAFG